MGKGDAKVKILLVPILARAGCEAYLPDLRRMIADDGNPGLQTAAVRAVSTFWPGGEPAGLLLQVAKLPAKEVDRVLALRGCIRLVHVPRDRPADEKVRMCRDVLAVSKSAEEKKLLLGALGRVASPEALEMAVGMLSDAALKDEAAVAAVRIAGHLGNAVKKPGLKEPGRAAMQKVLAASKHDGIRRNANAVIKRVGPREAAAVKEQPTSPPAPPTARPPGELEKQGFRALLDKDLSLWKADDEARKHWSVAGGVLHYDGRNKELWTKGSFGNFVLMVDWRFPARGDSGIFLRGDWNAQVNIIWDAMGPGGIFGYRVNDKMPKEVRRACTPKKRADKPIGQWNRFVITMRDDRVTVVLNGEEVISQARLPGVPKTGAIGLQHHGTTIDFANIYIKALK